MNPPEMLDQMLTWHGVTVPARRINGIIYTNGFVAKMQPTDRFVLDSRPYVAVSVRTTPTALAAPAVMIEAYEIGVLQ